MKFDFSRLNWPQATVLLGIIAGAVTVLLKTPPEVLAHLPWEVIVGGGVTGAGGIAAAFLHPVTHVRPDESTGRRRTTTLRGEPPPDEGGDA